MARRRVEDDLADELVVVAGGRRRCAGGGAGGGRAGLPVSLEKRARFTVWLSSSATTPESSGGDGDVFDSFSQPALPGVVLVLDEGSERGLCPGDPSSPRISQDSGFPEDDVFGPAQRQPFTQKIIAGAERRR